MTQTLPFFMWGGIRMRKTNARVPSAKRLRHFRTRFQDATSRVPIHTGEIIPMQMLFEQPSYKLMNEIFTLSAAASKTFRHARSL
jgi:hypothetical protein